MPPRAETTRVETIKLPLPEPYTGARGKAEVFLEGMEAYFQFSAPTLPDKDKVALASYLLRDAARSWFKGAGDGALSTWNSFKEQLSKRFALHNAVNTFSDALYSLRQNRCVQGTAPSWPVRAGPGSGSGSGHWGPLLPGVRVSREHFSVRGGSETESVVCT